MFYLQFSPLPRTLNTRNVQKIPWRKPSFVFPVNVVANDGKRFTEHSAGNRTSSPPFDGSAADDARPRPPPAALHSLLCQAKFQADEMIRGKLLHTQTHLKLLPVFPPLIQDYLGHKSPERVAMAIDGEKC